MTPRTSWRWTPEIIQVCSLMWNQDKSYLDIAREFGITRNMVSGLASRNRDLFPNREKHITTVNKIVKKEIKKKVKVKKAVTVKEEKKLHSTFHGTKQAEYIDPALDDFEIGRLPGLSLLDNNGCFYPLTSCTPHMFCSHVRMLGKRYCEYHVEKTKGYQGIAFGYRERYDRNIVRVGD